MNEASKQPEPLNLATVVPAMKAIRWIFENQSGWLIHIEAPFRLVGIESLRAKILFVSMENKINRNKLLQEIQYWATANMQFYDKNIRQQREGQDQSYYSVLPDGRVTYINTEQFGQQYKPQLYQMPQLNEFCNEVHKLTTDFLTEKAEPQEISIPHRISEYISFKLKGEEAESVYQFKGTEETIIPPIVPTVSDPELALHFLNFMHSTKLSTCHEYLKFHLSKYLERNPGKEIDFFSFVVDRIKDTFFVDGKQQLIPKSRIDEIKAWVNEPRQPAAQVNTEPPPKPKRIKKGNPVPKSFIDYLDTDNNEESLKYLKAQFSGLKGQAIAYMIFALGKEGIHALKPYDLVNLHRAILKEFGKVGYEAIRKTKVPTKDNNPKKYEIYKDIMYRVTANIPRNTL